MPMCVCVRCLAVATEMLKHLQLRRLPVTLKTMVDLLVNTDTVKCMLLFTSLLPPSLPPSLPPFPTTASTVHSE